MRLIAFLKRHRYGLTATFFLLSAVVIMMSVRLQSTGGDVRGAILDVVGTLQRIVHSPVDVLHEASTHMDDLTRLYEDNQALRQELARLRPQVDQAQELFQENRRLRDLLQMGPDPSYQAITSRVVGDSSSAFARSFLISSGEAEGVDIDQPVVNSRGLVGRVVQRGRNHALILSILDFNSRIPVLVQRSRERGVAVGNNDRHLDLQFVAKGGDIQVGDQVVTSGLGGVFPKGLVLGRIFSVEPFGGGLFQKVLVRPTVDFDRLEEVRILRTIPAEEPS